MKKIWKIVIIVVVVLVICIATCPGYQRHSDAIFNVMSKVLHEQAEKLAKDFGQDFETDEESKRIFASLEQSAIDQIEPAIKQVLKVKNYVIFSIGRLENEEDGVTTISVGFLGMVFPNKKDLNTDSNGNSNRR